MKKAIALFLVAVILLFLAACNGASMDTDSKKDDSNASVHEDEKATEAESEAASQEPEDSSGYEEITVADNDNYLIRITGINPDNSVFGHTINYYLENRSSDKTYSFSISHAAVNGLSCCPPVFASRVAPGATDEGKMYFIDDEVWKLPSEITDIELTFCVQDDDNWQLGGIEEKTIHVYPYGEAAATPYEREPQPTDTVIVDNESITIIITGYEQDLKGYRANVYLVNKTDDDLMFGCSGGWINGQLCFPLLASILKAGNATYTDISWSKSTLETSGMTTVDEIIMNFKVSDSKDFSKDDIYRETVTLYP